MGVSVVRHTLVLLAAAFAHGTLGAPCDAVFCRCVPASALAVSAQDLVHRLRDRADRVVLGRVVGIDTLAPHVGTGTAPELEAATTITALGAGELPER